MGMGMGGWYVVGVPVGTTTAATRSGAPALVVSSLRLGWVELQLESKMSTTQKIDTVSALRSPGPNLCIPSSIELLWVQHPIVVLLTLRRAQYL